MSIGNAKPKEKFVPSYQISGKPFVTSSAEDEVSSTAVEVRFPTVTRWVQIRNTGSDKLIFGFSEHGIDATETANYMELANATTSPAFELRCKSVFLKKNGTSDTNFTIIAGLTDIADLSSPLSGSGGIG